MVFIQVMVWYHFLMEKLTDRLMRGRVNEGDGGERQRYLMYSFQQVLRARSQSSVELVFTPSPQAYNELGSSIHCYLLGYMVLLNR